MQYTEWRIYIYPFEMPKFYPLNAETRPASTQSVALKEIYDYPRIDVAFPLDDLVGRRYETFSKIAINHVSFIDRAGKVSRNRQQYDRPPRLFPSFPLPRQNGVRIADTLGKHCNFFRARSYRRIPCRAAGRDVIPTPTHSVIRD